MKEYVNFQGNFSTEKKSHPFPFQTFAVGHMDRGNQIKKVTYCPSHRTVGMWKDQVPNRYKWLVTCVSKFGLVIMFNETKYLIHKDYYHCYKFNI